MEEWPTLPGSIVHFGLCMNTNSRAFSELRVLRPVSPKPLTSQLGFELAPGNSIRAGRLSTSLITGSGGLAEGSDHCSGQPATGDPVPFGRLRGDIGLRRPTVHHVESPHNATLTG